MPGRIYSSEEKFNIIMGSFNGGISSWREEERV